MGQAKQQVNAKWIFYPSLYIKIAGRNINNLRYADDTILMTESKEELKSLLMKMKEQSEKADLKLNIQKMKIMASGPITSWQIDGETVETVADFNFWGSKITADGDCSHEIKRRLLLGRKVMTNQDSIFKSINFLVLSLLYGPTFTSVHDYWKYPSFDSSLCWQSNVSAF